MGRQKTNMAAAAILSEIFFLKIVINHLQYIYYSLLKKIFVHLISLGGVCAQRIGTTGPGRAPTSHANELRPLGMKYKLTR